MLRDARYRGRGLGARTCAGGQARICGGHGAGADPRDPGRRPGICRGQRVARRPVPSPTSAIAAIAAIAAAVAAGITVAIASCTAIAASGAGSPVRPGDQRDPRSEHRAALHRCRSQDQDPRRGSRSRNCLEAVGVVPLYPHQRRARRSCEARRDRRPAASHRRGARRAVRALSAARSSSAVPWRLRCRADRRARPRRCACYRRSRCAGLHSSSFSPRAAVPP